MTHLRLKMLVESANYRLIKDVSSRKVTLRLERQLASTLERKVLRKLTIKSRLRNTQKLLKMLA